MTPAQALKGMEPWQVGCLVALWAVSSLGLAFWFAWRDTR
jgi:hypothetical protein